MLILQEREKKNSSGFAKRMQISNGKLSENQK